MDKLSFGRSGVHAKEIDAMLDRTIQDSSLDILLQYTGKDMQAIREPIAGLEDLAKILVRWKRAITFQRFRGEY